MWYLQYECIEFHNNRFTSIHTVLLEITDFSDREKAEAEAIKKWEKIRNFEKEGALNEFSHRPHLVWKEIIFG